MENRIIKLILCLTALVPFSVSADEPQPPAPSEPDRVIGGHEFVLAATPIDLLPLGSTEEQRTILMANVATARTHYTRHAAPETTIIVDITTSDFGQLKSLLAKHGAESATTLTVSGPIDASDFKAIWECAIQGNLQILDLAHSQVKDNIIPDYALYDPVQFECGHWLCIRKIMLPESIVKIGKAAFPFMYLEEINIPSSLRELGSTAFGYDYWLNCPINIPEGVTEIKYQTFIDCRNLIQAPSLPASLKIIGEHAFANTPFEHIELNDGLETIRQGAFQSCGISEIVFPNSVKDIEPMSFQLCPRLEHIVFPTPIEDIPMGIFSMCNALNKVCIPEGVKHIADNAFMLCVNLREIYLPETLESIGQDAFYNCNAETIVLPHNLKSLGEGSFYIQNLHSVYCKAEMPPFCDDKIQSGPFDDTCVAETILYIPIGCKELYQNQWEWSRFKEIVETDDFPEAGVPVVSVDNIISNSKIYDLNGRTVINPMSGQIYIRDGIKIVWP